MAAAFGIHLGCSSACLAVYKDGKTDVVANDAGDRTTPAVVAFTDHDQAVGLAAKHGMIRNAANTICNVTPLVGKTPEDPEFDKYRKKSSANMYDKAGKIMYAVEYKGSPISFSPQKIASLIYQKLMDTAKAHGDGEIHDSVLAVPVSYDEEQQKTLKEAAEYAGFKILRIIPEPSAALLAYDIGQNDIHEFNHTLVYKLGGNALHIAVFAVNAGMYRMMASYEDDSVGGYLFDQVLVDHFASEFQRQWKCDPRENKRSKYKLLNAAEHCKHVMSRMGQAQFFCESLYDGTDFLCKVARPRFEGMCSTIVRECLEPLEKVLKEAGLTKENINKVILSGGSTKIPIVQKGIQDYFNQAEILMSIPPDEVIAIGTAKQAAILTGNDEESCITEKDTEVEAVSRSVYSRVVNGCGDEKPSLIFPSLTPIPARRAVKHILTEDAKSFLLEILERPIEKSGHSDDEVIARIFLNDLKPSAEVTVLYHVKREGSLHVTCSEKTSGKSESILIESS